MMFSDTSAALIHVCLALQELCFLKPVKPEGISLDYPPLIKFSNAIRFGRNLASFFRGSNNRVLVYDA